MNVSQTRLQQAKWMAHRATFSVIATAFLVVWLAVATDSSIAQDDFQKSVKPFLKKYCFDCHEGDGAESEKEFSRFASMSDVTQDLETWNEILAVLDEGSMPPEDADQPLDKEVGFVQDWILKTLEKHSGDAKPLTSIRRLNRVEYENTIRDLFRLSRPCFSNPARLTHTESYFQPASGKMPRYVLAISHFSNSHRRNSDLPNVSTLPVDPPVEHGFANDHSSLSFSPLLMENYFEVANAMLGSDEFEDICAIWRSLFVGNSENAEELKAQARRQLAVFLPRAFRRNVTAEEETAFQKLFETEFAESGDYTEAMKTTVAGILVSPNFLFRGELSEQPLGIENEEQFKLASRLSYFLWASTPDDELLQAAREGRLDEDRELERQVLRMLKDRRCKSLSTDFGMQWLKLQKAATVSPDKDEFPDYYRKDVQPPAVSMMIEQMLLFETIMVENRSVVEFISADFGYLNRSLMDWYFLEPSEVLGFTPERTDFEDYYRVKWPSIHRGGIATSGAMLISTSTTTRSSPVYRGAWIMDVIFNSPPPPPPPDIAPLVGDEEGEVHVNVRKRLEVHREDPACAVCHDRIDPLGFALERFDATGRWRNAYPNGDPIDAKGDLDGDIFDGPARFKNVLLRKKTRFVQAFVEHTMKYAMGRQLHYSDEPEIRRITERVIQQDARFQSVIVNVVLSDIFRK